MSDFKTAYNLASAAHAGQFDKSGAPYIEHPKAVARIAANIARKEGPEFIEKVRIVAMLLDTVEDTDVTLEDIRAQFGDEIADAVDAVTKREGEQYHDALLRVAANPIARVVKLADMTHNSDLTRFPKGYEFTDKDKIRTAKYRHYIGELQRLRRYPEGFTLQQFKAA